MVDGPSTSEYARVQSIYEVLYYQGFGEEKEMQKTKTPNFKEPKEPAINTLHSWLAFFYSKQGEQTYYEDLKTCAVKAERWMGVSLVRACVRAPFLAVSLSAGRPGWNDLLLLFLCSLVDPGLCPGELYCGRSGKLVELTAFVSLS